jgi:hypothetical protein
MYLFHVAARVGGYLKSKREYVNSEVITAALLRVKVS